MIRMAQMGALVVALCGGVTGTETGKDDYTAKWDFRINPLGRVVDVRRMRKKLSVGG